MKVKTMEMKLRCVPVLVVVMLGVADPVQTTFAPKTWTAGPTGLDLSGKMFTLSSSSRISFYAPKPRASRPWTTSGASVCLRFITDFIQRENLTIFTLSPANSPLNLTVRDFGSYTLSYGSSHYSELILDPMIRFCPGSQSDMWTGLCLTVDSRKNLTQLFSLGGMSIRKFLPKPYVWSGEPAIDVPGFDGQLTDIQVWDYPLSFSEVSNYMSGRSYRLYRGSVLSWSNISYSVKGNALVEDANSWEGKKLCDNGGRRHQLHGKKTQRFFF